MVIAKGTRQIMPTSSKLAAITNPSLPIDGNRTRPTVIEPPNQAKRQPTREIQRRQSQTNLAMQFIPESIRAIGRRAVDLPRLLRMEPAEQIANRLALQQR